VRVTELALHRVQSTPTSGRRCSSDPRPHQWLSPASATSCKAHSQSVLSHAHCHQCTVTKDMHSHTCAKSTYAYQQKVYAS
jgi:hypothetical protein